MGGDHLKYRMAFACVSQPNANEQPVHNFGCYEPLKFVDGPLAGRESVTFREPFYSLQSFLDCACRAR